MFAGIRGNEKVFTMIRKKLLITGCNGLIGTILWEHLADSFELYGLDLYSNKNEKNIFQANIAHPEQIRTVFDRIPSLNYIVHLAGDPRMDADWGSVNVNNISGTKNIYEAAQIHKVKRVIFASSNHVTGAYEGFPPGFQRRKNQNLITTKDPIRPDGFYGVSKAAGEAIARMYYELYGLEAICIRIGSVLKDNDPRTNARYESTWLSHRDLVQLVKKSLLTDVKFGIYYGVSKNRKRFWDITDAEAELDYHPEDDASSNSRLYS
jgi:nucleoside-diphosphate-sugar epimerase